MGVLWPHGEKNVKRFLLKDEIFFFYYYYLYNMAKYAEREEEKKGLEKHLMPR